MDLYEKTGCINIIELHEQIGMCKFLIKCIDKESAYKNIDNTETGIEISIHGDIPSRLSAFATSNTMEIERNLDIYIKDNFIIKEIIEQQLTLLQSALNEYEKESSQ